MSIFDLLQLKIEVIIHLTVRYSHIIGTIPIFGISVIIEKQRVIFMVLYRYKIKTEKTTRFIMMSRSRKMVEVVLYI